MTKGPTKGQKKLRILFGRLIESDFFRNEVVRIRSVLELPANGSGSNDFPRGFLTKYEKESATLQSRLPLINDYLLNQLRNHVLYNEAFTQELGDVCEIEDAETELARYEMNEDPDSGGKSAQRHNDDIAEKLSRYPISVRIHVGASQNAVVDFIKKNWKEISDGQKSFSGGKRSPLKSSKTRVSKEERNKFIYDHRDMLRKQLAKLVRETYKGETLDGNDVGKIISIEEKRRKA